MLAHERMGAGEPLVLLHGITHRRQAWLPVADHLAEHREIFLVDLPGHGESPGLRAGTEPPGDRMVADLLDLFDHLGLDRPHVAGNSLGGRLALELAARGAARSVTALSPAGFWRTGAEFRYTVALFRTVMALAGVLDPYAAPLLRTRAGRAALFFWINSHPTWAAPEAALGDFRGLLRARPEVGEFFAENAPFNAEVPPEVPVTIAWATRDIVLPVHQAKTARALLPHAEHVLLPGCGHVPMGDDPYRVAMTILRGSHSQFSRMPDTSPPGTVNVGHVR
ncbi:pimeloyl-ACP methyl ester carboxylesterase [Actinocorallia herbida]|uniref:Pimeloyl-ACP methyl ester carboxylesterase n=1 Tax=Actinocorallia herbida TaxID=58109 RepID=A0A3N1D6K4_9ACTN|nr:alpha/beta hydrolase [Actinocorallia herbida]ROO89144.1 pimeloyl-ACP methyl ester carboxylesterase [Actinocorallia herbida]